MIDGFSVKTHQSYTDVPGPGLNAYEINITKCPFDDESSSEKK